MFEKFIDSATNMAVDTFSAINALHFGVLRKMGVLDEATTTFTEIIGSDEPYNLRLDNQQPVQFQFSLNSQIHLDGFFDPKDDENFMKWHFVEGSYVSLPGIAENSEIFNGKLILKGIDEVEYSFEFVGKNGEEYIYRGTQKFSIFNPIQSWKNIKGKVVDKETGEVVLDSISFIGNGAIVSSILPFLSSVKID